MPYVILLSGEDCNASRGLVDALRGAGVQFEPVAAGAEALAGEAERVRETLEQTMKTAFAGVYAAAERFRADMRTGAYVLAVGRVAEATRVRGIFP